MGGAGEPIEHAVRMRQFPREDELDRLLAAGRVAPAELASFGRSLARIHEGLPSAHGTQSFGSPAAVRASLIENVEQCIQVSERVGVAAGVRALAPKLSGRLATVEALLGLRRDQGRVRECHGDLHSRNVVRHAGHLIAFDCMEFEPAFRWIDVAEEIAFLLMDLHVREGREHAIAFLSGYVAQSGDFQACRLVRLYAAHRALVRAKVAALEVAAADNAAARERALAEHGAYVLCAQRMLETPRPTLILMSGLSGSGKTWLTERLAPLMGAVHVRSDVERKRMAGLAELARSDSALEHGLYTPQMNARLYCHLADCARHVLAGGFSAVIDATFQRRADRASFAALARECGVPVVIVRCQAPKSVLESRVASRGERGSDASEANLSVLEWQHAHAEPIDDAEGLQVIEADTTRATVVAEVEAGLNRLTGAGAPG
jgi:aminoglycoside phosphotransferase family enzyme/predicted kinase